MGLTTCLKADVWAEKKLKKKLNRSLENTSTTLMDIQSTVQSTKTLVADLEKTIERLEKIQVDAVKIGNFNVYMETEKFKQVTGNLYGVSKKMETDMEWMQRFVSLVKKFNEMYVRYKEMANQFKNTSKGFQKVSVIFGDDHDIKKTSVDLAREMQRISNEFSNFKVSYVPIASQTSGDVDMDDIRDEFEKRRKALLEQMPK